MRECGRGHLQHRLHNRVCLADGTAARKRNAGQTRRPWFASMGPPMASHPCLATAALFLLTFAPAQTQPAAIPVGSGELQVNVGTIELTLYSYRPAAWSGQRMVMVMHGVRRNADEYRDFATGMADRLDALVIAPKFDADRFPSRAYQRGGVHRSDGTPAEPTEWTYALVPQIADQVRARLAQPTLPYWILGHSAGGQFAMRMAALQDTGAERIVAANPGSVLMPTLDQPWGYGFGGLGERHGTEAQIRRYLAAPLTLYLGTADDVPDENFDKSDEAMLQGAGRHQRGLAAYWSARTLAKQKGWEFGWRLVEAPGVAHNSRQMFDHENCATALFGPTKELPAPTRAKGR